MDGPLWNEIVLCFFRCGGVWRFVRILANCVEDLFDIHATFTSYFEHKIDAYYTNTFTWLELVKVHYPKVLHFLCLLSVFGTPLQRNWKLFPASIATASVELSPPPRPAELDYTVGQAEASGIIYTHYPRFGQQMNATQVVNVIVPEVLLSRAVQNITKSENSLPAFQYDPWTLSR